MTTTPTKTTTPATTFPQTWFRVNHLHDNEVITAVQVVDRTAHFVHYNRYGRIMRHRIAPDHFPTWAEAYAELLRRARNSRDSHRNAFLHADARLSAIERLTDPTTRDNA